MNIAIDATVWRGFGVATKNLKSQLPHLIKEFPELENIHTATINVHLEKPLRIAKLERTTSPLRWWDAECSGSSGFWHTEQFSIVPIVFEFPVNAAAKKAWLFISHDSSYFAKARLISGVLGH